LIFTVVSAVAVAARCSSSAPSPVWLWRVPAVE
jgi:hypothetical protein